ncbi:Ddl-like protein [Caulifigura coniformis]|uniref:Ddl-like protein n=1 Tax=Caulifigura coniformis TaxID=2527983 RepID=A0A517SFM3_9PLAN|nr:D-alanine--D-alanine ligase [Caulifigura coniformis]QDT54925.1 Ddl-like protein [Caulifigura coniformis]
MHVAILHQFVPDNASADERDVLTQVEAVSAALGRLGHSSFVLPCTLDLAALAGQLTSQKPEVVFNLVESLNGTDALQSLVPLLVESLHIRCTGSSGAAILDSGRKRFAKSLLRAAGLPTPASYDLSALEQPQQDFVPGRYILKPDLEHASLGMTDADVVDAACVDELQHRLVAKSTAFGRPIFAEAYVDGREFNLSLLETSHGVRALPAAEIRFVDFPEGKPKIVGSAAKWDEESFEYTATVRSFERSRGDAQLVDTLTRQAIECWQALGLRGYARVDFRVDPHGRSFILEANANPCLSPDAGFAAAAAQAGLIYNEVIRHILAAAC